MTQFENLQQMNIDALVKELTDSPLAEVLAVAADQVALAWGGGTAQREEIMKRVIKSWLESPYDPALVALAHAGGCPDCDTPHCTNCCDGDVMCPEKLRHKLNGEPEPLRCDDFYPLRYCKACGRALRTVEVEEIPV